MANYKNHALSAGTALRGREYTYVIEKVLGQGSFGITYLASTSMTGPLGKVTVSVALKEFFAKELDSRQSDGTVSTRTEGGVADKYARAFKRESENLSKMRHPGIVNVLESFEAKGTFYYSMEYLAGGSLDDKVKGDGITEDEALPISREIGEAISYMHEQKLMHLDLKPKNIMLKGDGTPVLIDFGLSKQYDDNGEPESSSTIGLGTPGYAPIEQATQSSGRVFQPTLDVYALGATLYKMLTGSTPPTASEILNDGFPDRPLLQKSVSGQTIDAIRAAMSPGKKSRPQSVAQFLQLLSSDESQEDDTILKPEPKPMPCVYGPPLIDVEGDDKPKEKSSKTWLWVSIASTAVVAVVLYFVFGKKGIEHETTQVTSTNDTIVNVMETVPEKQLDDDVIKATKIKLSNTALELETGQCVTLVAIVSPSNATDKTVVWKSDNAQVALVSKMGMVTALKAGTTDIAAICGDQKAFCRVTVKPKSVPSQPAQKQTQSSSKTGYDNGHEWMDLGLPSGTKWATYNVGASSPTENGDYYAWGETSTKSDYSWANYRFRASGDSNDNVRFNKYNTNSNWGAVDNKAQLDLSDDAARANWGGKWRIPTRAQWWELRAKCTWSWTGSGYRVTGPNGQSITIPASGYRYGYSTNHVDSKCYYWSSSLDSDYTYLAWFFYTDYDRKERSVPSECRGAGLTVRPVTE